jgi:hypothetical protein
MRKTENTNARVEDDAVERSLRAVRDFHAIGRGSLDRHPGGRMPYGGVTAEAERVGLHPEMLRKARAFAAAYREEELGQLFKLCRRHRYALGVSHVIRLLSVPDKRLRTAMQRRLVTGDWSYADLEFEILKEQGIRSPTVGRRRRVPSDGHEACLQLARFCEQWRRLSAVLCLEARARAVEHATTTRAIALPARITRQGKLADEVLSSLSRIVTAELKKLAKPQTATSPSERNSRAAPGLTNRPAATRRPRTDD